MWRLKASDTLVSLPQVALLLCCLAWTCAAQQNGLDASRMAGGNCAATTPKGCNCACRPLKGDSTGAGHHNKARKGRPVKRPPLSLPLSPPRPTLPENLIPSFDKWEQPVIKGIADGILAMVSLGFAAFTFLFGSLIALQGDDAGIKSLKKRMRGALYLTAVAVALCAPLAVIVFISIGFELPSWGLFAIILAGIILLGFCGITVYLAIVAFLSVHGAK
jgi:hypothetical protein